MALNIPGYAYDAATNRYFKLERAQSSPANHPWTPAAVAARQQERNRERHLAAKRHRIRLGPGMGTSVSGAAGTGAADETEGVRVSSSISSGGGGGIRRCSALFGSESGSRFDGCGGLAAQSLRRSFFGPVTSPAASHATLCAAAAAAWNEDYDHNYDKAWCLRALGGAAWAGTDNADGPLANAFEAQGPVVWVPDNVQEAHMVSYQEHDGPGFVSRRCDPAVLNLAAFVIPGVEGGVEDVRYVFANREHSPMHELQSQSWTIQRKIMRSSMHLDAPTSQRDLLVSSPFVYSLKFHAPSKSILRLCSGVGGVDIWAENPHRSAAEDNPRYFHHPGLYDNFMVNRRFDTVGPHTAAAADPHTVRPRWILAKANGGMTVIEGHSDRWTVMEVDNCPPVRTDLSVEFHSRHRDVVFAGGRRGSVRLTDLREATTKPGLHWRHAAAVGAAHASSAVTHLRSVDDNHVLVAGLRSTMCLYDIRCLRTPRQPLCRLFSSPASSKSRYPRSIMAGESYRPCVDEATVDTGVYPVVTFPDYQNEAHIRTGLDVLLPSSARGLCPGGLVAAAHDDGTVAIYSLRTGRRLTWDHSLRDGKTRNLRKGLISTANRPPQASLLPPDRPTTVADIRRDTPVRCLQFATLPRPKRGESVDRDFTKWVRDWRNRGSSASHQESPRTFDDDDGEEYSDQKQLRDGGLFGQFGPDYGSFPSLFVGEGECIVEYAVGGGVAVDEW